MGAITLKMRILAGIIISVGIVSIGIMFYMERVYAKPLVTVYKTSTCGCCSNWVKHMEENGFRIHAMDVQDLYFIKQQFGIPGDLASCHTAIVDGYLVEGHVPASDVQRLLSGKHDVAGISVPGMPVGSPGMEMGNRVDRYAVYSFDKKGDPVIFSQY
jgi:hypothetical protein